MQATLDRVSNHLRTLGIKLRCVLNPKATPKKVDAAEQSFGHAFPRSYIDFVTQQANGFTLSWTMKSKRGISFEMVAIDSSVSGAVGMRDWRLYSEDAARSYGFPHVKDSQLAMRTNQWMHRWLPFHKEGNGDFFSVNVNSDGFGNVIFDAHDWLDGGTGDNGFLMAPDLATFFEQWGNVCFCQPKTLWWKSVLTSNGIDWGSELFDSEFRLSR